MASKKRRKSSRSSSNIGCLIFLAGFIILLVVFAIKFPDIKKTLDDTGFLDALKNRRTTTTTIPAPPKPSSTTSTVAKPIAAPAPTSTTMSTTQPTFVPIPPQATAPAVQTRQASLYFVHIDEDGVISRREVKRNIPVSDSPLTDAINALIAGPSEGEIRSGLVSLIPRGTRVLSITLRGSTAIIDLSDAFSYNHYGVEGYSAQLRQIVYTATSFPSVQDVQFLVEGKQKDYLGGEGVYIGKPLSRNSF
ncbi:MAG: GerMN domain-containing protein [Rectinemataceae bacterium]|nr:GerMN domain-containing protein [Rectinemataceae bacterium]